MSTEREETGNKQDSLKTILWVVVPVLIAGPGLQWLGSRFGHGWMNKIGHMILITGIIWIFCRSYVQFLWRKYPWDAYPFIHIVFEVLGIGLFSFLYGLGLYRIEVLAGSFKPIPGDELFLQAFVTILITYLITGIHEMIYFYNQWIMNFSKSIRLERDNIQAKYEILKAQVNPHFLFNSLNSLTGMVEDNSGAVDHIQNLSEFLRYVLGSRDKDLAYLKDEIRVLNNYLEIQKSRFLDNLSVDIRIPGKYGDFALPPLVIQMLVENCIKHNVISMENPLKITIVAEDESVVVTNNLHRKAGGESTGQGLKNIIDRYGFFTKREVLIRETEQSFSVTVPLIRTGL